MNLRIETAERVLTVSDGLIQDGNYPFDVVIRIPDGFLHPGLINAHDHLRHNHYGRLGNPPYADAYEWGHDIHERYASEIEIGRAKPRRESLLEGAWKNLRSGVTTVVHHDPWEADFDRDFPLRVVPVEWAHSLGFESAPIKPAQNSPFFIHLAEGTSARATAEVDKISELGLLNEWLCAIHVVGADARGIAKLRHAGAAIVWCPSSNLFLFNQTASPALLAPGIDVMIGSDSLLTADGDLLDELRVAANLGFLDETRLQQAVGSTTARRLGIPEPNLDVGSRADVIVLRQPLGVATQQDVALVIANGILRVLDPALLDGALREAPESAHVYLREAAWRAAGGRRPEEMHASS